jgi:hypothetical protein
LWEVCSSSTPSLFLPFQFTCYSLPLYLISFFYL